MPKKAVLSIRIAPAIKERYSRCQRWVREHRGTSMNKFAIGMIMDKINQVEFLMKKDGGKGDGNSRDR